MNKPGSLKRFKLALKHWLAAARRLSTWLAARAAPDSFGVVDAEGRHFCVPAHGFRVTRDGRLAFWRRRWLAFRETVSVVEAGRWQRVLKGVKPEDL